MIWTVSLYRQGEKSSGRRLHGKLRRSAQSNAPPSWPGLAGLAAVAANRVRSYASYAMMLCYFTHHRLIPAHYNLPVDPGTNVKENPMQTRKTSLFTSCALVAMIWATSPAVAENATATTDAPPAVEDLQVADTCAASGDQTVDLAATWEDTFSSEKNARFSATCSGTWVYEGPESCGDICGWGGCTGSCPSPRCPTAVAGAPCTAPPYTCFKMVGNAAHLYFCVCA
jgi:hypothetical protein